MYALCIWCINAFCINAGQYEATCFSVKSDLISAQRQEKIKGAVNIHECEGDAQTYFHDSID